MRAASIIVEFGLTCRVILSICPNAAAWACAGFLPARWRTILLAVVFLQQLTRLQQPRSARHIFFFLLSLQEFVFFWSDDVSFESGVDRPSLLLFSNTYIRSFM